MLLIIGCHQVAGLRASRKVEISGLPSGPIERIADRPDTIRIHVSSTARAEPIQVSSAYPRTIPKPLQTTRNNQSRRRAINTAFAAMALI